MVYCWEIPALENVSVTHTEVPSASMRVVSAVSCSCLRGLGTEERLKTSKPGCNMGRDVTPTPQCLMWPTGHRATGSIPSAFPSVSSHQTHTGVSGKEGF